MVKNQESLLKRLYEQRLQIEHDAKSLPENLKIKKGQKRLKLLPISNLYYGSTESVPRIEILLEQIKQVNDMEEGAFFFGGNLFYYPRGVTDEKNLKAVAYSDNLAELLKNINKDKLFFVYDGVNELKFRDDRKLKYPINITQMLLDNLGIDKRKYFKENQAEIDFVFNNELTNHKNQSIQGLFTSIRPISASKNAILKKMSNHPLIHGKDFVVDTSSSHYVEKTIMESRIASDNKFYNMPQKHVSVSGYTFKPQLVKVTDNYNINTRFLELSVTLKIKELCSPEDNVELNKYDKNIICRTIGNAGESSVKNDMSLIRKLNDALINKCQTEEQAIQMVKHCLDQKYEKDVKKILKGKDLGL